MAKLAQLLKRMPQYIIHNEWDTEITGITDDSRQVSPGNLFVAIPGFTVDGHQYISTAINAGAVAIVGEYPLSTLPIKDPCIYIQVPSSRSALGNLHAAWFGFPSDQLTLIGVTGTDGKTTTVNLIYAILIAAGINAGMVSTVNARIGMVSHETGLHTTTPLAVDIQRYLADMVLTGASHAVLETTSHGLSQHRLAGCEFDAAVITNVTHEHLDIHGSWEAYMAAKAQLFVGLLLPTNKSPERTKVAIINYDDGPSYDYLMNLEIPHLFSYSTTNKRADVKTKSIQFTANGLSFLLESPWGGVMIHSPLVGLYNVSNILAAVTTTLAIGIPIDAVVSGVGSVEGVSGRMERVDMGQDFLAIVDFAHTPNALERILETAREIISANKKIIVVFGCAGLRDKDKRWMMGDKAGQLADKVVITAEDPRTESLSDIMSDIEKGLQMHNRSAGVDYWLIADRGEAIRHAVDIAAPGDIVLACGKGHEQSMCFGTVEYPWDDRKAMQLALQGKFLNTLPTAHS
jgi:UDP-N-acetylmuramoyl-L-alanyl-D-glutamate--2,6-diaminopimelate ligase